MAYPDDLTTARDSAAARLVEVLSEKKPSYSIDGESISWTEYAAMLTKQIEDLTKAIQIAAGPFEITNRAFG
jgi:tartrate dehydratase beta subunit/fumarate hydratase class I family protein